MQETRQVAVGPYITERKLFYDGPPLESGGTSIVGKEVAALKIIEKQAGIVEGMTVLDYGAGKMARNADYLRRKGVKVYAYDPFHSKGSNGWAMGAVSQNFPRGVNFDVGFTSYVLNVVPRYVEKKIIAEVKSVCNTSYHVTRAEDIYETVKRGIKKGKDPYVSFFLQHFATPQEEEALRNGTLSDDVIMEFCQFGVQTVKGFQRIPMLEKYGGASLVKHSKGSWKLYKV